MTRRPRSCTCCATARCTTRRACSTAGCPATTCPSSARRWPSGSPRRLAGARRHARRRPRRWSARRRPPRPIAEALGLDVAHRRAADRGRQRLRGQDVRRRRRRRCAGRSTGSTCATRSGRPGASRTREIAARMLAAIDAARDAARGHEAVLVSHQLPIWTARSFATGPPALARPAQAAVLAGLADVVHLRRRRPGVGRPTRSRPRDLLPVPAPARQEVRRRGLMTRPRGAARRTAVAWSRLPCCWRLAGCTGGVRATRRAGPGLRLRRRHASTLVAAADRAGRRCSFAGTTLDGQPFDCADHRGRGGRGERLGLLVRRRASPRRRRCRPCYEQTRGRGRAVRRHQHPATSAAAARAHERRFGVTYPSIDDDGGRVLLGLARHRCRRRPIPTHAGARPRGPRRRARPRQGRRVDAAARRRRRRPRRGTPQVDERRRARSPTARCCWPLPLAVAGRAGVVPVAVRAAAGARLPGLRHRADRRPRCSTTRRAARPPAWRARCCSSPGSPSCSSAPACCSAASAGSCSRTRTTLQRVLGVLTIVLGLAFLGAVPWLQRDVRRAPQAGASGWPARRCSACCSGSAGRRASARPWARCWRSASTRARRCAAALLAVAYCLGLGLPFVLTALAFSRAMAAFGWVKRHYVVGDARSAARCSSSSACCW